MEKLKFQFSLVSTVFNEIKRLDQTIKDIEGQTILPDEIIITDAGSNDGTYERLVLWKKTSGISITILQKNRCNVAEGRNMAIQNAQYNLIVSTDFGCRFHPQWLESLIAPFYVNPSIEVVGGAFTVLNQELKTTAAKSDYILQNGYQVNLDEYFSVSSRSIVYKKDVWEKLGGYPEWLTLAADDTIFWKLIKKGNYNVQLVDKPYVFWMRHQTNKAFGKEAFRYGLGDGESRINFNNFLSVIAETSIRYILLFYISILPFLIIKFPLALLVFPTLLFGLRPYKNAYKNWKKLKRIYKELDGKAFFNCLLQIEISRINYINGYIKGIFDKDPEVTKGKQLLWKNLG